MQEHYKNVRRRLTGAPARPPLVVREPEPNEPPPPPPEDPTDEVEGKIKPVEFHTVESFLREVRREKIAASPAAAKKLSHIMEQRDRLPHGAIWGTCRQQNFTRARMEWYYHLYYTFCWGYAQIGYFIDRDHTTIMHGVNTHTIRIGEAASKDVVEHELRMAKKREKARNRKRAYVKAEKKPAAPKPDKLYQRLYGPKEDA